MRDVRSEDGRGVRGTARVLCGDSRVELARLPARSVHCCVTSPPYFGLRVYGGATWEGGEASCKHKSMGRGGSGAPEKQTAGAMSDSSAARGGGVCRCGAVLVANAEVGSEGTVEGYINSIRAVMGGPGETGAQCRLQNAKCKRRNGGKGG